MEKPFHTINVKCFFSVDSTAHAFMFNLTPCSTMNTSVWKADLTWIPSESLLTRKLYSGNAENEIQLKNWHFILNAKWFRKSVSGIKNWMDKLQRRTEMIICENVFEFYLEQLPEPCTQAVTVHANLRHFRCMCILLFWHGEDPGISRSFKGERVSSGHPTMAGLLWRICVFQKLEIVLHFVCKPRCNL